MVGSKILQKCIRDKKIKQITVIVRKHSHKNKKIKEIIHTNFLDFSSIKNKIKDIDVIFYCIGTYQGQVSKEEFIKITYKFFVQFLKVVNQTKSTFCLLSAQGANEESPFLFAKWKGACENYLLKSKIRDYYIVRPGYIHPENRKEVKSMFHYKIIEFFYPMLNKIMPKYVVSLDKLTSVMYKIIYDKPKQRIFSNKEILAY